MKKLNSILAAGLLVGLCLSPTYAAYQPGLLPGTPVAPSTETITVAQSISTRWNYAAASAGLVSTTGVTAKAAAGASIKICVTGLQVINSHASTSTDIQIRDGASGTVLWRGWAQAGGGGVSADLTTTPVCGTSNTLLEIAEGTATTTTGVYVNLQGYTYTGT